MEITAPLAEDLERFLRRLETADDIVSTG